MRPEFTILLFLAGASLGAQNSVFDAEVQVDRVVTEWRRGELSGREVERALGALGEAAGPYLRQLLDGRRERLPVGPVAGALGQTKTSAAAAALGRLLQSGNVAERQAAVDALGAMHHPSAYPYLVLAIEDVDVRVATAAESPLLSKEHTETGVVDAIKERLSATKDKRTLARLLGRRGGDLAHDVLMGLAAAPDASSQLAGLEGLWFAGESADAERVLEVLEQTDSKAVQSQACLVLGKLRCRGAARKLIDLLQDGNDPGVAESAHWALKRITGLKMEARPELWEAWWKRVGRRNTAAKQEVNKALDTWRIQDLSPQDLTKVLVAIGGHAVPYLCELLDTRRAQVPVVPIAQALGQLRDSEAAGPLGGLLESQMVAERLTAVEALGKLDGLAYPYLVLAVEDVDVSVAKKAESILLAPEHSEESVVAAIEERLGETKDQSKLARLLGRRGGNQAHAVLMDMGNRWWDTDSQLAGLQGLWYAGRSEDGERLTKILTEADSDAVRRQTCLVVGKLGCWGATRSLIDLLHDEDNPGLAANAHWALKRITGLRIKADPELWELWWRLSGKQEAEQAQAPQEAGR